MEIPVYLFTGFLEAGKTKFIQETISEQSFFEDGVTLLLICEEGVEEYIESDFESHNVFCEYIQRESDITPSLLSALLKKHSADFVMVEYNGMWQLRSLYDNLPNEWFIYQELMLCNSSTIMNYNKNMRSLVVDKLSSCDMVAFNRVDGNTDRMALHKLVRGVSRSANIVYDMTDGTVEYDDIEDPLPFDINAEIITIEDNDFAYWYRDIAEETDKYNGKKIHFKGVVLKDDTVPRGCFFCGRHVMTCCADDIKYSSVICEWQNSESLKSYDWVEITGEIAIKKHVVYACDGPVVSIISITPSHAPEKEVADFS